MTRSTEGMSRPRAARSVVKRREGEVDDEKVLKFLVRAFGVCLPWRGTMS